MPRPKKDRRFLWISLLLFVATLTVYSSVFQNGFIALDDGMYVADNHTVQQGITAGSVSWAFSTGRASNWHPLTWLSHMLDVELFGLNPRGHHAVNLLFHTINALLLFGILERMTGAIWRSAVVAALFALHPLHVESVAWVAERKDVLSTFFGLLSIGAYVRYVERRAKEQQNQGGQRAGSFLKFPISGYLFSLFFFALSLMSKPMLVTLPFVLLLLDFWPLERFRFGKRHPSQSFARLVLEKLPFLVLSVLSCVITYLTQLKGGAVRDLEIVPLQMRLANAAVSFWRYLGKTFWPENLSIFYPYSEWPGWLAICAGLLVVVIAVFVFFARGRRPYMVMGWLWFLGTLVPVIGLVQVGNQAMADRYTYVPLIGLFIALCWSLDCLGDSGSEGRTSPKKFGLGSRGMPMTFVTVIVLVACGALTFAQARRWKNTETLFTHALAVTKNNYLAHSILGMTLQEHGRAEEANAHFRESLRILPDNHATHSDFARTLLLQGRREEAIAHFEIALSLNKNDFIALIGLADAFVQQDVAEGINRYRHALQLHPRAPEALNNLAWVLATSSNAAFRNGKESVQLAEQARGIDPQSWSYLDTLAAAYAEAGRFDDAVDTAQRAVNLASSAGQSNAAAIFRTRLQLYRQNQPFHK